MPFARIIVALPNAGRILANVNTVASDVASSWIYQQDYMTFLAVLGWLTAGLIAWGNAAAGADARSMPWKRSRAISLHSAASP